MDGSLTCESELGEGCTFILQLPLATTTATQVYRADELNGTGPSNKKHVLLVDDDPLNLAIASRMINHLDCHVTSE